MSLAQGIAQFAMILYLVPLLPGKIAWKVFFRILLWWGAATGLYILLRFSPETGSHYVRFPLLLVVTVVLWFIISMLLPAGRENMQRLVRFLKRVRK